MKSTVHNPARVARMREQFSLGEVWRCGCGEEHSFGAYAAAHWSINLSHTCSCHMVRTFRQGLVVEITFPRQPMTSN